MGEFAQVHSVDRYKTKVKKEKNSNRTKTKFIKPKAKVLHVKKKILLFLEKIEFSLNFPTIIVIMLIPNVLTILSFSILTSLSSATSKPKSSIGLMLTVFTVTTITSAEQNHQTSTNNVATQSQSASANSESKCPPSADLACLRCIRDGCVKCPDLLIQDTRICINNTCPSGYTQQWSSSLDFMGKICIPQGMSAPLLAVITGLISGCIICFSCLLIAIILIKRKRRKSAIKNKLIHETTMDRSDFLRQLEEMRPNAEYFLAMLNDTRRQIRKLYLSGEIDAANAYRPVIRDLAKILILLNRPIELIPAPPNDWNHIYTWAEQSLEKYKPRIGQLIDFLQSTAPNTGSDYYDNGSQQFSDNYGGSFNAGNNSDLRAFQLHQNHQQIQRNKNFQLFGSLISLHELEDNSRRIDPFGSNFNTLRTGGGNNGNLITDLNASSLWLEDEFFRLGFRPQDEITTEL